MVGFPAVDMKGMTSGPGLSLSFSTSPHPVGCRPVGPRSAARTVIPNPAECPTNPEPRRMATLRFFSRPLFIGEGMKPPPPPPQETKKRRQSPWIPSNPPAFAPASVFPALGNAEHNRKRGRWFCRDSFATCPCGGSGPKFSCYSVAPSGHERPHSHANLTANRSATPISVGEQSRPRPAISLIST